MPYLYKVQIRDSQVGGKGVFALEDIPEGATLWVCHSDEPTPPIQGTEPQQNRAISREQLQALQAQGKTQDFEALFNEATYYADQDVIMDYRDGTQYTNHSQNANTKGIDPESKNYKDSKSITTRKINKGEEIFEDYSEYQEAEPQWFVNFIKRYNPQRFSYYPAFYKNY